MTHIAFGFDKNDPPEDVQYSYVPSECTMPKLKEMAIAYIRETVMDDRPISNEMLNEAICICITGIIEEEWKLV